LKKNLKEEEEKTKMGGMIDKSKCK
jgi:hypothetical protein